jgi:5-methylcytosine-specific restriction enzyme subunit McrC
VELVADSHVGVIRLPGTVIEVQPKLPMDRFFFLLSYAVDPSRWRKEHAPFAADQSVLEAVAPAFCNLVSEATYRGLLHGYRTEEQALPTVRGQIRFGDQVRRHQDFMLPVELRYDEYTEDILENRLLLAALHRIGRLPLRSMAVRRALNEISAAFHAVTLPRISPSSIPQVRFDRLNRHYEPALRLAMLILKWSSLELGGAAATGTSFLIDMNELFELFLYRALREALHLSESEFRLGATGLWLDEARQVRLLPDLSWWRGGRCCFVGDAKYKKDNGGNSHNADLYQMLAYLTASGLSSGMLVYAEGDGSHVQHVVQNAGKQIIVESLDLAAQPDKLLRQVQSLGAMICQMAAGNGGVPSGRQPALAQAGT